MTVRKPTSAVQAHPSIREDRRADRTPDAAWRLALANIGLAYKLASRFAVGSRTSPGDLRQQAIIALHHAAVTFDAGRGLAFSTHAWTVVSRSLATIARNDATRRRNLPSVGCASLHWLAARSRDHAPENPPVDLAVLDDRERYVLNRLFGLSGEKPAGVAEIASELGCHRQTVRRIRDRALARLRVAYGTAAEAA